MSNWQTWPLWTALATTAGFCLELLRRMGILRRRGLSNGSSEVKELERRNRELQAESWRREIIEAVKDEMDKRIETVMKEVGRNWDEGHETLKTQTQVLMEIKASIGVLTGLLADRRTNPRD